MDQKYTNDAMFYYYKDLDENLGWSNYGPSDEGY